MNKVLNKITAEFFYLEFRKLKNKLPSARDICESIMKFAVESESELVFLSTEMPVRFFLNGSVYSTHRGGSIGGPIVLCYLEQ